MNSKKGFTLIEVVLAVSILSIMGLAVLNLFMSATKTNNDIKRKIKASYMAQEMMEQEKADKSHLAEKDMVKCFTQGEVKGEKKWLEDKTLSDVEDTGGYVAKVEYEKIVKIDGIDKEYLKNMPQDIFKIRVRVYFNRRAIADISSLARKDKPTESGE